MNLTDMLAQHIDEGGGAFCSCQPIDDETGEREHLPGTWEQHLADQIREWLVPEAQKFDPSDDYHRNRPGEHDLNGRAYYAGIDRVCALIEGRINTWTDTAALDQGNQT